MEAKSKLINMRVMYVKGPRAESEKQLQKYIWLFDSHANPIDFEITEGQVHDIKMAPELRERTPQSTYTIADKGYDGEYLRWVIRETKSIPVIPRKENSKIGNTNLDKTA